MEREGPEDSLRPLDQRILDKYDSLPPKQRALADVLLEKRLEFSSYSASELALVAGVSKATAARLFQRLGYSSFGEARYTEREARQWGAPIEILETSHNEPSTPLLSDYLLNDQSNLQHTYNRLDPENLMQALQHIDKCKTLWILGLRASFGLAHYSHFLFNMLKRDVRLLPVGGLTMAEEFANIEEGDVLFVVALRRRPKVLRDLLRQAHKQHVTIILITDLSASVSTTFSAHVFRCHARGVRLFDSYCAAASVLNLFATSLGLMQGGSANRRLSRIEELHDVLNEI